MLSLLASQPIQLEEEPIDRDPGILTLLARIVAFLGRRARSAPARFRAFRRITVEAELSSSSTAWPYGRPMG